MAYLLERGLFMAINKPTFHRKPPLSSSLSSYPNAQQILNRKLLGARRFIRGNPVEKR